MDRQIVYAGSIPLDTDLLGAQRDTMIALGYLAQATLGTTTVADGLACTPTQPASMSIVVGPGSVTQFGSIDTNPFGSLPPLANPLLRMGINIGSSSFTLSAPVASGQAITYLVEATLLEADAGSLVLPYYNASNPTQPFSGPGNAGTPQMTERQQTVQLAVKPSAAAAIGSYSPPAVDAGWVGLYLVTVAYGQQSITASDITMLSTAPFLNWKLPQLSPGTHNLAVFQPTTQGTWSVPPGVTVVKVRLWGGGGAGGNGFGTAGGGGAAGGYTEGYYPVTPGQTFTVTVGAGGAGAGGGAGGGTSSFGSLTSATGGSAGASGTTSSAGAGATAGGVGFGSGLSLTGGPGGDGAALGGSLISGPGGGSYGSAGGLSVIGTGLTSGRNGNGAGSGASGGVASGIGGQGGPGLVLVEW